MLYSKLNNCLGSVMLYTISKPIMCRTQTYSMNHHFHMVQKAMRRQGVFKFLANFLPGGSIVNYKISNVSVITCM